MKVITSSHRIRSLLLLSTLTTFLFNRTSQLQARNVGFKPLLEENRNTFCNKEELKDKNNVNCYLNFNRGKWTTGLTSDVVAVWYPPYNMSFLVTETTMSLLAQFVNVTPVTALKIFLSGHMVFTRDTNGQRRTARFVFWIRCIRRIW